MKRDKMALKKACVEDDLEKLEQLVDVVYVENFKKEDKNVTFHPTSTPYSVKEAV